MSKINVIAQMGASHAAHLSYTVRKIQFGNGKNYKVLVVITETNLSTTNMN